MWRKSILAASCILILVCFAGCLSISDCGDSPLIALEKSCVFWPVAYPLGDWTLDPGVEDVWFLSADGTRLHGWYAAAPHPRAVVLFAHGNAGNITDSRPILHLFRDELNASILIFDYRGYGKSDGKPSELGLLDDARAGRLWLAQQEGKPESDIVLVGHSLGGGIVVDLAARDGARGLVLMSTFTSLPDAAESHVPLSKLMHMRFDSLSKISDYHGPLLQAHGDADKVIPFALGRTLFDAANEPKQFVPIPGGNHNDLPTPIFIKALNHFLAALPISRQSTRYIQAGILTEP
jgi:fermentation-respiration switch protein FrsA (DUF1100 family)